MKLAALTLLTLILTGCATTPVSTEEAVSVPETRIVSREFLQPKPGYGEIVIKRDVGFTGSATSANAFVDGTLVAKLRTGEKLTIYLPPGPHVFGTKMGFSGLSETSLTVAADKKMSLRIRIGAAGELVIQPTAT